MFASKTVLLSLPLLLGVPRPLRAETAAASRPEPSATEQGAARGPETGAAPGTGSHSGPDSGPAHGEEGEASGAPGAGSPEVPFPLQQTVVTATRFPRPIEDTTTFTTVLTRDELRHTPDLLPDAWLRQVSPVATFRRSSSLVADPSSQGLNLRGIGPSSVSRGLLLVDGIPANDAFGGWIYWLSLPRLGIERVEVAPGGASALYGSSALGGVVQLLTREAEERSVDAELAYGTQQSWLGALRAAERIGDVGVALEVQRLGTEGYPVIAPDQRGPVDAAASSFATAVHGRADWDISEGTSLGLRGNFFDQNQDGGTRFTSGDVRAATLGAVGRLSHASGRWSFSLYGRDTTFRQQRARFAAERQSESLASRQVVPSQELGGTLQWNAPPVTFAGRHEPALGVDVRRVRGSSLEALFPPVVAPEARARRDVSGEQQMLGAFLQHLYRPGASVQVQLDLRFDAWRNLNGERVEMRQSGAVSRERFAARTEHAWSPRLGARWQLAAPFALVGSLYRSFRAPTLNELYRPFQVGTILTASNPELRAETLLGGELGGELTYGKATLLRASVFHNRLDSPIAVASLPSPVEGGPQRQRQNLGASRSTGFELTLESRPWRALSFLASYSFNDARVTQAPELPDLVGKLLPQVAPHRGSLGVRYAHAQLGDFSATAQVTGPQYEDDLNQRRMGGFLVVDARWSRALVEGFGMYLAGENLFNRQYLVGRAGVDTIGQPRMLRLGLTYSWPG